MLHWPAVFAVVAYTSHWFLNRTTVGSLTDTTGCAASGLGPISAPVDCQPKLAGSGCGPVGARSAATIALYRCGFLTRFSSQGSGAPSPGETLGTQEYLSV